VSRETKEKKNTECKKKEKKIENIINEDFLTRLVWNMFGWKGIIFFVTFFFFKLFVGLMEQMFGDM